MKAAWLSGKETITIRNPGSCQVTIPGIGTVQLDFDETFRYLRLWCEPET